MNSSVVFSSGSAPVRRFGCYTSLKNVVGLSSVARVTTIRGTYNGLPGGVDYHCGPNNMFRVDGKVVSGPNSTGCNVAARRVFRTFGVVGRGNIRRFKVRSFLYSGAIAGRCCPTLTGILFRLTIRLGGGISISVGFVGLSNNINVPCAPSRRPGSVFTVNRNIRGIFSRILIPTKVNSITVCARVNEFVVKPCNTLIAATVGRGRARGRCVNMSTYTMGLVHPTVCNTCRRVAILNGRGRPYSRGCSVANSLYRGGSGFTVSHVLPGVSVNSLICVRSTNTRNFSVNCGCGNGLGSTRLLLYRGNSIGLVHETRAPGSCFTAFSYFSFCNSLVGTWTFL